jgi:hypothetical protein
MCSHTYGTDSNQSKKWSPACQNTINRWWVRLFGDKCC